MEREQTHIETLLIACHSPMEGGSLEIFSISSQFAVLTLQVRRRFAGNDELNSSMAQRDFRNLMVRNERFASHSHRTKDAVHIYEPTDHDRFANRSVRKCIRSLKREK
ncbi:hypothetical protein AVEN_204321-1 [Araneus ventricosus]|uniref:Uncharacterized protein n=1 Tax=Araneus ventricosus TaxID=182803 RepID=A0A4Y2WNP2_ARAVE|nr:hypothetical protein AVEN_245728-1 [Araneus ventricosus]GBO38336.1 hypothetical protein AVEN_254761-1 [Araneus ventricosus]GBO39256.1 hypothetical protein AVEN_94124-1 [Araneus ventricosus]GBO39263.1 hypothetical protein AVEN_204321-1 [Araneus ventricosus]